MIQSIIECVDRTDGFGKISMKISFLRALQMLHLQPGRGNGKLIMKTDFIKVDNKGETSVSELEESAFTNSVFDEVWDKDFTSIANDIITAMEANFSISKGGAITWNKGAFSRLTAQNEVSPRIMLAEYVTGSERIVGYIIMDKQGKISTVKRRLCLILVRNQSLQRSIRLVASVW